MIGEDIAALLGAELAGQVEQALAGRGDGGGDVELGIVSDGSHLPARAVKQALVRAALAGQAHDPEDVLPLLDWDSLGLDGAGNLTGDLAGMLEGVRREKPYLFAAPALRGAAPAQPAAPGGQPPLTGEELGRLSMEEYRRYRNSAGGFPDA